MRKNTTNTFSEGMIKDLNPLTTPTTALTDAVNATLITYNGDEFVLQNDMGNCKVERARLSPGFIPLGMKEYGGIMYIASYNPETGEDEVGAFPSPERDFSTSDFENLAPANFKDTEFILTTSTLVTENTSVIRKLAEPEVLQLNPGDKYVVVYNIKDPAGTGNEILNQAQMDAYISKDVVNRKLFKLKFYKITDDNNLSEINPKDIKVIQDQENIEDEYVYFKENSKGTIAVGLETEGLDMFEANVIDTSRRTVNNKSVAIEAIGYSNSLADFKGVKVDVTSPENKTFYIDKGNINRKVSAIVKDLVADSTFSCSITPYSNYSLFPKLRKDFQVELGKFASAGAGTNNIFRYRTDPNFIKVDFDFKFAGDSANGLHLYVEFYDPWSDYSVVKTIDNPTYFGINSFIMELVDEPAIDTFNTNTRGGTPTSELMDNSDNSYEKTLLNSTGLIRRNGALRKNHFYIVRISGVDADLTTAPATYTHYDLYKGLYTNTMFNDIYDMQNSVTEGSPNYVADFNTRDYRLNEIKYVATTNEVSNVNQVPVVYDERADLVTDGKFYKISRTQMNTTAPFKSVKVFENNKTYAINLKLEGTEKVFGTFKESLLEIVKPTLGDSESNLPLKPTITDENYDNDPNIDPDSYANWELKEINNRSLQLVTKTTTNRSVFAAVGDKMINTTLYKEIAMGSQFYHTSVGPFPINRSATVYYRKYDIEVRNPSTGALYHHPSRDTDDAQFTAALNAMAALRPGTSAFYLTSDEDCWFYPPDPYHSCKVANVFWKQSMMVIRLEDGSWKATRTHDFDTMRDFWNSIKVASNITGSAYAYFPSQDVKANVQVVTNVRYPEFNITTNFRPTTIGVKTYLSNIMFKALGNSRVEFNTATINNYIATRKGDSVIVDNSDKIRDGFIPYIIDGKQYTSTVKIPNTVINQSADNAIVSKLLAGESQLNSDATLNPGRYPHMKIFSENPNYQQFIQYMKLEGGQPGTEITPQNVQIRFTNTGPNWIGKHARVGRCDGNVESIDLVPTIMITKP